MDGGETNVRRRGEHKRPGGHRRGLLAGLLVLLVAGLVGVVAPRSGLLASAAARLPWSSKPSACRSTHVTVVTAPEVANAVQRLVAPLHGRRLVDGSCLVVDLDNQRPLATVHEAASNPLPDLPQLWVPDSSLWISQARAWPVQPVGSLATSPVILAGSSSTVERLGWSRRPPTWTQALRPNQVLIAPGVTDDAALLVALLTLARSQQGADPLTVVAPSLLAATRAPSADLASAIPLAQASSPHPAMILTTAQRLRQAEQSQSGAPLVTVTPAGPPAMLDYPVTRVRRASEDPVVTAGTDLVAQALTAPGARAVVQAAGFGPPAPATLAGDAAQATQAGQFVDRLRALAAPSSTLLVVDTSLSMAEPIAPGKGLPRIALAAQTSIAATRVLPGNSNAGLWTFAGRSKSGPHREVVPLGPLNAAEQGRLHADVLDQALESLPRRIAPGGTALYDTALAAIRDVRRSYQDNGTNIVVVFTDGLNDYDGGLTLPGFVRAVQADARANPQQRVTLVTIGIGPIADMKALRAMAAAAGGSAFQALNPSSLLNGLFAAFNHSGG